MQGTVVMLLALSGLGCHHKKCEPAYVSSCYSSCYSSGYSSSSCYSSGYSGYSSCYSGSSSCYSSSCYSSSCYSSCYSSDSSSCYSSCYSTPRHHHGLFGHKRNRCQACCEPAPVMAVAPSCDACSTGYGSAPVYGTYTPVYEGYASGQMGSSQAPMVQGGYQPPVTTPATSAPGVMGDTAPAAPTTPSNPAPVTPPNPTPSGI